MINELNKNYSLFTYDNLLLDLKNSMDVAGKTGTSDNSAGQPGDASFIMYTPTMTLGMWAGNSCGADQCPLEGSNSTGEGMYQNLYKGFLEKYRGKIEPARFETDVEGLTNVEICPESGHKYSDLCPSDPISITVADGSVPPEEGMFSKEYVARCDGDIKIVEDEDRDLIDAKEETFFTYTYPIERIQEQVNEKLGRTPPNDTCDLSDRRDDDDRNIGQVEFLSPQTGQEFNYGEEINISVSKPETLNLERVDIALNNIILQSFNQNQELYEYSLIIEDNDFVVGNNTIKVIAVDTDGNTQNKEINIFISQQATPTPQPTDEPVPTIDLTPTVEGTPTEDVP
jgi:membrane peptidoglycan carboxypeptidase